MNDVLERIRQWDAEGVLTPYIEANAAEFPAASANLLSEAELLESRAMAGLGPEVDAELLALARTIRGDRTLLFLYFHCCRLAYELGGLHHMAAAWKWPSFDPLLPGRGNAFLLLVALSAVPRIGRIHRVLKVTPDVTRATCSDIAIWVATWREFHNGELGVPLTCVHWLRWHVRGELFRLGRLQFHPTIWSEPLRVYRRRSDGEVLILAEPDLRFTPEGFHDGAGGRLHPEAWHSVWDERDGRVTANRILPNGRAGRQSVTIALEEWRLALDSSSAVLNTHIPRGSRISLSEWGESIRRGFEFFRTVRPVVAVPAACGCKSWMFDPRLQELLPETSGLVTLQRHTAVFPLRSRAERSGLSFIFGDDNIDLDHAPRDTSLRRAVIDFLKGGGALSGGGMVLFEDQVAGSAWR